jgi:hypothetical protein
MAITPLPTRQIFDTIPPTDVNTLSNNDIDLDTRVTTIENSYFTLIKATQDVINNEAVANTLKDTMLQFDIKANKTYAFYICIVYNAADVNTGSRWVLTGSQTPALLGAVQYVALTTTTQTINYINAFNLPAACNASSAYTTGNIATFEGIIKAGANADTIKLRFASEVANSAITFKAGSYMLIREVL